MSEETPTSDPQEPENGDEKKEEPDEQEQEPQPEKGPEKGEDTPEQDESGGTPPTHQYDIHEGVEDALLLFPYITRGGRTASG